MSSARPAPPFTTSNLQQEASRKLGFTTSKTMQIAQQLYEGVDIEGRGTLGLISYIRTDSVRLSDEAVSAAREAIESRYGAEYVPEKPVVYKGRKVNPANYLDMSMSVQEYSDMLRMRESESGMPSSMRHSFSVRHR